jgi:hypothetical protein
MRVEITRPGTEQDLPKTLRLFLQALPPSLIDQIKAGVKPNVDAPYQDWTARPFRCCGRGKTGPAAG